METLKTNEEAKQKQKPLSEDKLLEIYKKLFHANVNVNVKKSEKRNDCYRFAREIEKAHGIS